MAEQTETVDREKKCPFLLRVFITENGRHHHLSEFQPGQVPSKEVQIYTWMDATLKELTALIKEVNGEARKPGTRFKFSLVFPDMRSPSYRMREIGSTLNGRKEPDDTKTLGQARFHIGDFLDVAICSNSPAMLAANEPRARMSGPGRPRFNGGDRDFGRAERIRPY